MIALYLAGVVFTAYPALVLGVNNGATLLGVILMAFSAVKLLKRGRA